MADWGKAFSSAAKGASGLLQAEIDSERKLEAEEIAADRNLKTQERLLAAKQAMENRAAERFAEIYKRERDVPAQQEAAPVTEFTAAGTQQAGFRDGMQGDAAALVRQFSAVLNNPNATDEQKGHAQAILGQLGEQVDGQKQANAKAVEGKTRPRSFNETMEAAVQTAMGEDAPAAAYGAGLLDKLTKDDRELAKQREITKREEMKEAGRDRRNREDNETTLARVEKQIKDAQKTGNKALEQQYAISLRTEISSIDREIREMERNKKGLLPDETQDIDATIADRRAERKQLVELQNQYFKDAGINVPEPPAKPAADAPAVKTLTYDPKTRTFK